MCNPATLTRYMQRTCCVDWSDAVSEAVFRGKARVEVSAIQVMDAVIRWAQSARLPSVEANARMLIRVRSPMARVVPLEDANAEPSSTDEKPRERRATKRDGRYAHTSVRDSEAES